MKTPSLRIIPHLPVNENSEHLTNHPINPVVCRWRGIRIGGVSEDNMNDTDTRVAYRLRAHTGPCIVKTISDKLRSAGCVDVFDGTQTVYLTAWGTNGDNAIQRTQDALRRTHDTVFGLQFSVDAQL